MVQYIATQQKTCLHLKTSEVIVRRNFHPKNYSSLSFLSKSDFFCFSMEL